MPIDYIYISDTKIDNYANQLANGLAEKIKAEIAANLGVLSFKLSTSNTSLSRYDRLNLVKDFIERNYVMGTLSNPRTWIKDSLIVQRVRLKKNPSVFLLIGKTAQYEVCALFGSTKHVLGCSGGDYVEYNASFFPDFAELVSMDIEHFQKRDAELDKIHTLKFTGGVSDDELSSILGGLQEKAKGPKFKVDFLARNVFSFDNKNRSLYASRALAPLFVATSAV